MSNESFISVIIPIYNIAPFIIRCVESVLSQCYKNLNIILVDDGSSDNSGRILDQLATMDNRIQVLHKKNAGVTSARIVGVKLANGDYIGFADGDDEIESDMYQRLYDNLRKSMADISHCGHVEIRSNQEKKYLYNTGRFAVQNKIEALHDLLAGTFEPSLVDKLYSKFLFHGLYGKMDYTIKENEDLLMNYYLFSRAKLTVFEDFCPYHYLIRSDSSTHNMNSDHIWNPIKVKQIIREDCIGSDMEHAARAAYLNTCLSTYHTLINNPHFNCEKEKLYNLIKNNAEDVKHMNHNRRKYVIFLLKFPRLYEITRKAYVKLK